MSRPDTHRRNKQRKRAIVNDMKAGPCVDCGQTREPESMHFHHEADDKVAGVSRMVTNRKSDARIMAEIAKCVLLCEHCHGVRHATERGKK